MDKATEHNVKIPPALLQAIREGNDEAFEGVVKAQMACLLEHALHRAIMPDAPPSLITGLLDVQRKISTPTVAEQSRGSSFHLTLNLGDSDRRAVTIEGTAQALGYDDE